MFLCGKIEDFNARGNAPRMFAFRPNNHSFPGFPGHRHNNSQALLLRRSHLRNDNCGILSFYTQPGSAMRRR